MYTHFLKNYFTARKKHEKFKTPPAPPTSHTDLQQVTRCIEDAVHHHRTMYVQCQLTRGYTPHRNLVHLVDTVADEVHHPPTCSTWMDLMFSVVCVHTYLLTAVRWLVACALDIVCNSSKMLANRAVANVYGWLATSNTAVYGPQVTRRDPFSKATNHDRRRPNNAGSLTAFLLACLWLLAGASAASPDLDKGDRFLDKINEQSIAAVFNKVAYGSTTKRSIPDNAYAYTTLATPLLTTYRYSDGNQEWYRVDVKEPEPEERLTDVDDSSSSAETFSGKEQRPHSGDPSYGSDLEKDHVLPTSAPAADILKNNNNKNYNNPNRYNNDRLRPELPPGLSETPSRYPSVVETVTEREPPPRTSTGYSVLRNVRPTKSMFGKEVPSYVPPSRSFFTPPLPPEYLNPFADKPTLRGTNSETYQNRRPIPPPSLMPKKDRIPFRPDLPPAPANEGPSRPLPDLIVDNKSDRAGLDSRPTENRGPERKKTLNTPSQNVHLDRVGEFYGLNRLHNESNFEYEPMVHIPSISRILSGSNGRKEDIPDVLLRTVTATPNRNPAIELRPKHRPESAPVVPSNEKIGNANPEDDTSKQAAAAMVPKTPPGGDSTPHSKNKPSGHPEDKHRDGEAAEATLKHDTTTSTSDILNLPNVKVKNRAEEVSNATKAASGHEIWHICWNVHVYLVVFLYVLLAVFSIVKLIRFERETHMFSKSYFLSVHLLLTAVCVLRIFYLAYDPYNVNGSFTNFTYDLLHNLPLSLLATTFAVLIVFLLKRTLNHLKVKTRPIFLVFFGLGHMFLCFCLNLAESFELFSRSSFMGLVCRFVYILLCWSLGLSYVYLYKIIKNVLAKKSQNLSEMCTQNISYASHITIAVALLFTLLGLVQLYGLFFIKVDRFTVPYHWILWGFELSVRVLEISIVTLLAIVVSLRMSQREKQNVGFPLFPCTTSDSSTDNIYPNNCSTNLNALNYSLRSSQAQYRQQLQQHQQELALENLPTDIVERPNLLLDKKSTLDRCYQGSGLDRSSESASDHDRGSAYEPPPPVPPVVRGASFDRFERPNWGSQRFAADAERDTFPVRNFERADDVQPGSGHFERSSGRATRSFERPEPGDYPSGHFEHGSGRLKPYEKCRYYAKPKYDTDLYNNSADEQHDPPPKHMKRDLGDSDEPNNVYSEPLDVAAAEYERRHEPLDRADLERRSRTSWNNSGRRSTGRSGRKPQTGMACRPHQAGVHTLPNQDTANSMLVDENGFVRFRQLAGEQEKAAAAARKHHRHHHTDANHYSDA